MAWRPDPQMEHGEKGNWGRGGRFRGISAGGNAEEVRPPWHGPGGRLFCETEQKGRLF